MKLFKLSEYLLTLKDRDKYIAEYSDAYDFAYTYRKEHEIKSIVILVGKFKHERNYNGVAYDRREHCRKTKIGSGMEAFKGTGIIYHPRRKAPCEDARKNSTDKGSEGSEYDVGKYRAAKDIGYKTAYSYSGYGSRHKGGKHCKHLAYAALYGAEAYGHE